MVLNSNGRYDYAGNNEPGEPEIYKCIFCSNSTHDEIQMYECYFYYKEEMFFEDVCADCLIKSEYIKIVKL